MSSKVTDRILVPYDGSKFSKKGLDQAMQIARETESTLYLLSIISTDHIRPPGGLMGIVSTSSIQAIKRINENAKKEAEKILSQQSQKCKKFGIKTKFEVRAGNISEEIIKVSKKKKITLIVIGSQGLHGFGKLKSLGSTSRKVSEFAHCPVMIVR